MSHRIRPTFGRRSGAVLAVATLAFAAACSSSSNSASTTDQAPTTGTAAAADQKVLDQVYKGTLSSPDTASRAAVKNKKIVVISGGQSSISSSVPSNSAVEAAPGPSIAWSRFAFSQPS